MEKKKRPLGLIVSAVLLVVVLAAFGVSYLQSSSTISGLNSTVASNKSTISGLNATVTSDNNKISSLNTTVQSDKGTISSLQGQISSDQAQISTLQQQNTTNQAKITQLQNQIASDQAQISSLQTQISSLQSQITSLQSQISSLESQIATLQAIVNLQSKVTVLPNTHFSTPIPPGGFQNLTDITGFTVPFSGYFNVTIHVSGATPSTSCSGGSSLCSAVIEAAYNITSTNGALGNGVFFNEYTGTGTYTIVQFIPAYTHQNVVIVFFNIGSTNETITAQVTYAY